MYVCIYVYVYAKHFIDFILVISMIHLLALSDESFPSSSKRQSYSAYDNL